MKRCVKEYVCDGCNKRIDVKYNDGMYVISGLRVYYRHSDGTIEGIIAPSEEGFHFHDRSCLQTFFETQV